MSNIVIRDLVHSGGLSSDSMSCIRGGNSRLAGLGPVANVNVDVSQNIAQLQNIEVNALNNVGVIGAGMGSFKINIDPKQWANASTVL